MNPNLLKKVDGVVGPVLARLLRKRKGAGAVSSPRSILVIRPGGIGDAVLLVPALRALQAAFPDATIDLVAEARNAAAFAFAPGIGTVHLYHRLPELASVLARRYDVVIDTEQWYRLSAVVARLVRAQVTIGFATNERKRLFSHPVPYDSRQYEAESFFRLLAPLGIETPTLIEVPFLILPAGALDEARRLLAPLGGRPFVTVFPGASVQEKQWGAQKFRDLIAQLSSRGVAVVLVGGGDCHALAEELAAGERVVDLTGRTSLGVTAAAITLGKLLITGDSGLLHIAAGLGTPTVSLFGPSDPQKWAPKGEGHSAMSGGVPCAPCSRFGAIPPCTHSVRCMAHISVDDVMAALDGLLDSRTPATE